MDFTDKVIVVTGGSSGIGANIRKKCQRKGAKVFNLDKSPPGDGDSKDPDFITTDLRDKEATNKAAERILEQVSKVDVLICNAGQGIDQQLAEGDPDLWEEVVQVNLNAHLRLVRKIAATMKGKAGDIVFTSSVAAEKPYIGGAVYSATKAAINAAAEALRLEIQPHVRVTVIAPGVVDTGFFENIIDGNQNVENIGWGAVDPDDVAETVLFALSMPRRTAINYVVMRPAAQPM